MKNLIVATVFLLYAMIGQAQSYIGVSIGVDYAQIREKNSSNPIGFYTYEGGYTINSVIYGIKGEQYMTEKFSLSLQLSYTKKEFDASVGSYNPINGLKFNSYRGALSLKWYAFDNLYFAPGFTMNYISDINYFSEDGKEHAFFFIKNKREYGGILSTGYQYKNFLAELSYSRGVSFRDNKERTDFKPINSIGLSLSYLFQVSKKKKR